MREVLLTQGKRALVNDDDYTNISKFKWFAHFSRGHWYAERYNPDTKTTLAMHNEIMQVAPGLTVHHKDNNGLNNQRVNLVCCTQSYNIQHMIRSNGGFRGVSWDTKNSKYLSQIGVHGRIKKLGRFVDAIDAAKAYDTAAVLYFGPYAFTNFKTESNDLCD